MSELVKNPKLEGSNIIDAVPQIGYCPNKCVSCFFNNGFYAEQDQLPLLPSLEVVGDKIVRVNSGNDSNNNKELVIESTRQYKKKFYNTSIPNFDFPAPVVYTFNPKEKNNFPINGIDDLGIDTRNIMFIRYRVSSDVGNLQTLYNLVYYFTRKNIPIVLTFMRYSTYEQIPEGIETDYEFKKHIKNSYWCIKEDVYNSIVKKFENNPLVGVCGKTYKNSMCSGCGLCEKLYNRFMEQKSIR